MVLSFRDLQSDLRCAELDDKSTKEFGTGLDAYRLVETKKFTGHTKWKQVFERKFLIVMTHCLACKKVYHVQEINKTSRPKMLSELRMLRKTSPGMFLQP
jgi:hypothetical protein